MRIMIVGGYGELGSALANACWKADHEALPLSRLGCDVTDGESCLRAVAEWPPDVIVNCAAYHKVDLAESDGADDAVAVNSYGAANLAIAAREAKARLVFVSTDYVFDGKTGRPYVESDATNPVNAYGVSKLAGELATEGSGVPWLVVRTAGLFGGHGKSQKNGDFFRRLVARWRRGEPISIVDDLVTSLTYVPDLAASILDLVEQKAEGMQHVVNGGYTTWFNAGLACLDVVSGGSADVKRLSQAEACARGAAKRPAFSALGSSHAGRLPHWEERLLPYVRTLMEPAP